MIGKTTTKLIIVCDEKTEPYANYLRQLISTNDDKDGEVKGVVDGTVDAAVWLDKEYVANKAQISSSEHILFVGDSKVSKNEASSMIVKFDQYGMKYGWLGKRAMMMVDNELLEPEKYDEFIEFCLGYEAKFEKIAMVRPQEKAIEQKEEKETVAEVEEGTEAAEEETEKKSVPGVIADVAAKIGAFFPAVGTSAALGITSGINKMQIHKKVKDQQYRALAVILYIDGLKEFLEG